MVRDVDVEELQTTKSEKLLAFVMAAFLLLGGVWIYQKIDDEIQRRVELAAGSAADQATVTRANRARLRLFAADSRAARARRQVEFTREEWRAALDANRQAGPLEGRYRAAQRAHDAARAQLSRARTSLDRAERTARPARSRIARARAESRDRQELYAFVARLGFVLLSLGAGFWLLSALRRRNSRWLPIGSAALGYATILAFVLAADYLTDYFDPFDYGVALVAVVGVVATALAYCALQRYLSRRLPRRRVRKGQCPFCGYPVRDGSPHCEGCGREVIASCARCEAPRRVGTQHCAACGAA